MRTTKKMQSSIVVTGTAVEAFCKNHYWTYSYAGVLQNLDIVLFVITMLPWLVHLSCVIDLSMDAVDGKQREELSRGLFRERMFVASGKVHFLRIILDFLTL